MLKTKTFDFGDQKVNIKSNYGKLTIELDNNVIYHDLPFNDVEYFKDFNIIDNGIELVCMVPHTFKTKNESIIKLVETIRVLPPTMFGSEETNVNDVPTKEVKSSVDLTKEVIENEEENEDLLDSDE